MTPANSPSPNTAPTTTGMRLKKPPDPTPFRIAKKISRPNEFANAHSAIAVTPITVNDTNILFSGPRTVSAPNPIPIRPSAEARFHAARMKAAVWLERPMEVMYSGSKNGGTNSGNVAMAPMASIIRNLRLRKRDLPQSSVSTLTQTSSY